MTSPAVAGSAAVNYVGIVPPQESAEAEGVTAFGFTLGCLAFAALLAGAYWLHASGRDAIIVWTVLIGLGITTLVLAARAWSHWRMARVFRAQVREK